MGNNMNCDSCSENSRNMMRQREMMNQKEMMYHRNMRMDRNQMNARNMNHGCNTCDNARVADSCDMNCDRNRNRCEDDCSRGRDMLYGVPLAMGYVPWQNFECTYEPAQALQAGTIFPELDKPFYGRRGIR